ncbi:MAG: hypothetical protein RI911_946 [Candidatus Parcubacteria bacterium]|jgi:hypothetical protein
MAQSQSAILSPEEIAAKMLEHGVDFMADATILLWIESWFDYLPDPAYLPAWTHPFFNSLDEARTHGTWRRAHR